MGKTRSVYAGTYKDHYYVGQTTLLRQGIADLGFNTMIKQADPNYFVIITPDTSDNNLDTIFKIVCCSD